jgi:hypothetical protein
MQFHIGGQQSAGGINSQLILNITCDFDMEVIRATTPEERTMRYCPPYAAAGKTGCPKIDKQGKSSLDVKNKRKRGDVNTGKAGGKRRSLD